MPLKDHYLTCAAFLLRDASVESGTAVVECSAGVTLSGEAVIRKLCICGSPLTFDEKQVAWLCRDSGANLEIRCWNPEPLFPPQAGATGLEPHISELSHPERESLLVIDEAGHIQLLVKVSKERLWVIQDPLPVFDNLTIKPIQTDLILNWHLWIGDSSTGDIDAEIPLNIVNPVHEKILELLASRANVGLHFFDAESLLALGRKQIRPLSGEIYSYCVKQVRALLLTLPREASARQEALQLFSLTQEASQMSWAERSGLCMEPLYMLSNLRPSSLEDMQELGTKLKEHVRDCERCRQVSRGQEFQ